MQASAETLHIIHILRTHICNALCPYVYIYIHTFICCRLCCLPTYQIQILNADFPQSSSITCPQCGTFKSFHKSCCGVGGSWHEDCGDPGDTNFGHSWFDGNLVCNRTCTVFLNSTTHVSLTICLFDKKGYNFISFAANI